ncbi:hypothetical protein QJS10_CPB19g01542 [Acorus calamus]|uniref:PHD-type zinc finger plants domain-containing protein n=1 Tax=Acorus calamus TaxID=4465 RepID=A0AAV9CGN6_ACOCL|nr:hypothetical protein QJS10_CPB19g01542 [Acorus calamus]
MGAKGGGGTAPLKLVSKPQECCMCGDHGLSIELFRCKICLFRSQHRYCSNLYPKVDSYRVCNWCLRDDGGKAVIVQSTTTTTTKTPLSKEGSNSPSSPSSLNTNSTSSGTSSPKLQQRGSIPLSLNKPIKKQRSPDRPPTTTNKKIVVVTGCVEESVRRMRSDEVFNAERPKPAFRGKVRRYKLLEEVSS